MSTNPERTGCGARLIDLMVGLAVGWSCGAYFFGRLAEPPRANVRAELYGALIGALAGVLLPEVVRLLERARVPREASRAALSLIAAAILGGAYGQLFKNACISAMLTLCFAACVLFFLDAAVGRSAGIITPLAQGARKEVSKLLLKMAAGVLIGAAGGFLRMHMKVLAITTAADVQFYGAVMLLTGAVTYPLLLLLFQGKKAVRGMKLIVPVLDGLLFAFLIASVVAQPTPSPSPAWSETIERPNWVWVPLGMFLGILMTFVFGGIQSILTLLFISNRAAQFAGGVIADGVGNLLGKPRLPKEPEVEAPLTPGQRTTAGCLSALSFVGVLCFGFLALCFGGGGETMNQKDDRDYARLPRDNGCPPACAGQDFSGWSLARRNELRGTNFDGAKLRSTTLWSADLSGASFRDAYMPGAQMMFARLERADLTGADLRGAVLTGAQLQGAVLRNANLERAQLQRANLSGATLRSAKLNRAVYDTDTIWPANFDPREAGAKLDGEP